MPSPRHVWPSRKHALGSHIPLWWESAHPLDGTSKGPVWWYSQDFQDHLWFDDDDNEDDDDDDDDDGIVVVWYALRVAAMISEFYEKLFPRPELMHPLINLPKTPICAECMHVTVSLSWEDSRWMVIWYLYHPVVHRNQATPHDPIAHPWPSQMVGKMHSVVWNAAGSPTSLLCSLWT